MNIPKSDEGQVAIITVTYNATDFIFEYLKSLKALIMFDERFSAVIVDNASSDGTQKLISDYIIQENLSKKIHFHASDQNAGFGTGCNVGASLVAENIKYFWFLNPDTDFSIDAGRSLVESLNADSKVCAVASVLRDGDGSITIGAFRFPFAMTTLLSNACIGVLDRCFPEHALHYSKASDDQNADWLTGASFMIRAAVYQEIKGFDETFFLYFEEVDLFYRLKQLGYVSRICSQSVVNHIAGASTGINNNTHASELPRKPAYWFESRRYFYIRHFGRGYLIFIDSIFVVANLIHRLKNFILRKPLVQPKRFLRDIVLFSGWR